MAQKQTVNPAIIAKGGNGNGTAVITGRPGWAYIRLHGDDNQLTEAKVGIALEIADLNDAWLRVRKASPKKASYYVVEEFVTSSAGDPTPPLSSHALDPDDGPHTGTLPEDQVAFDDVAGHDHAGAGNTGKKISVPNLDDPDGQLLSGAQKTDLTDGGTTSLHQHAGAVTTSVQISLMNRSGGQRISGDVVVTDPDNDESFEGTTDVGYQGKVVVVAETIGDLTTGLCWERGGPFDVKVTGAVDRNDGLRTSTTIYRAEAAPSLTGGGVFAIALSQNISGDGTVKALFLDEVVGASGGGGGAGAPTDASYITEEAEGGLSDERVLGTTVITTTTEALRQAAAIAGRLFFPSDGFHIQRDAGAAWAGWGPIFPMTLPALADFVWINQGGASADDTYGGIYILAPAGAGNNLRILKKAAPSTPYTVTAAFLTHLYPVNYNSAGFIWRESSSGKLVDFGYSSTSLYLVSNKFNSPTSWSAAYFGIPVRPDTPLFLRIEDDGSNRKCYWSTDGRHFHLLHSVGRTDFLTADEVGFYADSNNATYPCGVTLLSWEEG